VKYTRPTKQPISGHQFIKLQEVEDEKSLWMAIWLFDYFEGFEGVCITLNRIHSAG